MQFACLTQIVVRFALHTLFFVPSTPPNNSPSKFIFSQLCVGPEARQVTGRAAVQDNNEALLSLSLLLTPLAARSSPFAFLLCLQPAGALAPPTLEAHPPFVYPHPHRSFSPFAHFAIHIFTLPHPVAQRANACCKLSIGAVSVTVAGARAGQGLGQLELGAKCSNRQPSCTCILSQARFAFRLHFRLLIIATLSVNTPCPCPCPWPNLPTLQHAAKLPQ